jgi:hypothetical protein
MNRLIIVLFFLLTANVGYGQTTVKGLTPGKSTKTEVERVFGQPVNKVSETLIEYRPQPLTGKIFVQYREGSPVVERIEFICRSANSNCSDFLKNISLRLPDTNESAKVPADGSSKIVVYYAPPLYLATTIDEEDAPARVAFYSRDLYAVAVTKSLQELGFTTVEADDPGYEDIKGVVKVRAADGSLRPVAGASVTFCWPPYFRVCYASTKTNSQGIFSHTGLRGTYVAIVTGPGLKWTYKEEVRIPLATSLEFVAEPGDGKVPTSRDIENAVKKD